jgi:hypothetical protein
MEQEGEWEVYLTSVEDAPTTILVDLSIEEPEEARPHLACVSITLKHPNPHGMTTPEESERINAIEEEIEAAFAGPGRGRNVGHTTGGGRRDVYFYLPGPEQLSAAQRAADPATRGYEVEYWDQPDPEWRCYREFLYPGPAEMRSIQNDRVLRVLEENGDTLEAPRQVDHWIYFPTTDARAQFLAGLAGQGFNVEEQTDNRSGPFPYGVQISREDKVDPESINELTFDLEERAEAVGGDYDGWETCVVPPAS